jgi:hypothetical protein
MIALTRAAESNQSCPSNEVLTGMLGATSHSSGAAALDRLARRGLIEVERYSNSRVVTIVATGLRTAGEPGTPHWRAGNVTKAVDRKPQLASAAAMSPGIIAEPAQVRVDRKPCTWCGTRADVGCKHNRAAVAEPSSVHF